MANTTFVSLIASCALHGVEPWRYLRDLFYLLPDWPKSRVLELAPAYFEQTLSKKKLSGASQRIRSAAPSWLSFAEPHIARASYAA